MSKIVLLSIFLLAMTPCLAEDTKSTNAGADNAIQADASPAKHGHEHAWGKRAVLELSSLTDKQKEQVNAVYDADKAQWEALQKQMRELHESERTKVKALLTPEQLKELESEKRAGRGHGEKHGERRGEKHGEKHKEASDSAQKGPSGDSK